MTYCHIYYLGGQLFLLADLKIVWWPRIPRERVRPDVPWVATQDIGRDCPLCRIRGPPKNWSRFIRGLFFCLKSDFRLLYNPINPIC